MKPIKPKSFQTWILYNTINMVYNQHHATPEELNEAVELFLLTLRENCVIIAPYFEPSMVRCGTPVTKEEVTK